MDSIETSLFGIVQPVAQVRGLYLSGDGDEALPSVESAELGLISVPMPGVRCQGCAARGQETWVIPGKACHVCGTECSRLALNDEDLVE
ncbi:uncharacterized protein TRUGW13939_04582 [Talaromyces rugulosus]|uniref:Uncharacterized protein n=1 Tax=Talaromyces rugulosus TaxID=121627 RepID=A0A7H8QUR6_TALRU|nr:uncharacterized protein TRUGW13939_04582 [Talaromyces rugulosus]QKX57468.1 hypothetical protein TRUGW13939_04582 [Talaromyces rugulosus]